MKPALGADLERLVGSQSVSCEPDEIDRHAGDALGVFRAFHAGPRLNVVPAAVVWPSDASQVAKVLNYASRHQIPVVPYGAGTGVMGAAAPAEGCIVLSLQRMDSVVDINREDRTIRLQAGVILEQAHLALVKEKLLFGHDPWSRPIATVGGAISTNGVGYTAARFGSMGDQVLGLEAVLADGEVVRTKGVPKPASGPSLNHLFVGSEGTLGVITEATLSAYPEPEKRVLRAMVFPEFEAGFNAVAELYSEGVRPTVVDYGDESWTDTSANGRTATLYLGFQGFLEDVDTQERKAREICLRLGGQDGDQREVQRYWESRHASSYRYKKEVLRSPDPAGARKRRSAYRMDYLHVAIPVSKVLEYRRRCQKLLSSRDVTVKEWSLWGRPEFFSFLIAEETDAGEETSASMAHAVDQVLTLAQDMGGTMEYCHGVGIKLGHLVDREMGSGATVVRRIKRALDPGNILNPGKLAGFQSEERAQGLTQEAGR